jgi:hypothetical protein
LTWQFLLWNTLQLKTVSDVAPMKRISDIDDQSGGTHSDFGLVPDVADLPVLPRFEIRTSDQRKALSRLKIERDGRNAKKDFLDLVLAFLALIEQASRPKAIMEHPRTRNLRRMAARIRRFNEYLRRSFIRAGRLGPPLNVSSELGQLADDFDRQASGKRLPRRKTTTEDFWILELVEFVQDRTGEGHWKELVTLLQAATGDQGYNSHRLQSLCSFHRRKKIGASRLLSAYRMKRASG